MPTPPEERREAQIHALAIPGDLHGFAEQRFDNLLTHFEQTDQSALADAIRYGLHTSGQEIIKFVHHQRKTGQYKSDFETVYTIDKPIELCDWDCCKEEKAERDHIQ